MLTGKDLIEAGVTTGKHFGAALQAANKALVEGADWVAAAKAHEPPPALPLREKPLPFHLNIEAESDDELVTVSAVQDTMRELMKTPVVTAGALMPDACPAGPLGTIPVGGVVASKHIHPGMHSADICCSMAISVFPGASPAKLLDAMHTNTHFGPGGREDHDMPTEVAEQFSGNSFLKEMIDIGNSNFATQGDGNHFAYVGSMKSTGETVLVTHHGSRGPGARLYKAGMKVADKLRRSVSPETLMGNSWIAADTADGDEYWNALQIIRSWTKANHYKLHDLAASDIGIKPSDRFWNEHNFVFRKSDGLFYHAKGATPAFDGWAHDATDLTIIPLNMAEPILIVRGSNADNGLGFSPHGAGRNMSRTAHKRGLGEHSDVEVMAVETDGIDARFFMGTPDVSELPSAYKNAASVRAQIDKYGLAEVVDEVIPYGCIMAGDWEQNAPWRKKRKS